MRLESSQPTVIYSHEESLNLCSHELTKGAILGVCCAFVLWNIDAASRSKIVLSPCNEMRPERGRPQQQLLLFASLGPSNELAAIGGDTRGQQGKNTQPQQATLSIHNSAAPTTSIPPFINPHDHKDATIGTIREWWTICPTTVGNASHTRNPSILLHLPQRMSPFTTTETEINLRLTPWITMPVTCRWKAWMASPVSARKVLFQPRNWISSSRVSKPSSQARKLFPKQFLKMIIR